MLILPFLEEQRLYDQIDLNQPWNSPANRQLSDQMPRVYAFHGEYFPGLTETNYLAVVGDQTVWPPFGARNADDVTDDAESTILVVENDGRKVNWMEPGDLEFEYLEYSIPHPDGVSSKYLEPAVVMVDNSLVKLSHGFPADVLRAMLTVNGGEQMEKRGDIWSVLDDGRDRATRE